MKRSAVIIALCVFPVALPAQQLQEGTWSGSLLRTGGGNQQRQPQKVSLEFKKIPDPHWAWRPGGGEVWSVTLVAPQGRSALENLTMSLQTMSFSYMRGDIRMICGLRQQADDTYQGDCIGDGDNQVLRLTLNPPPAAKQ
jgi:hypothetical protein